MTNGFLQEDITVDTNTGKVDIGTDDTNKVTVQTPDATHVNAVEKEEEEETPTEEQHEEAVETMTECAYDMIRAADDCYIMVENTVARLNTLAANYVLAEAAGQDIKDEAQKTTSGAGKTILGSLVARLKRLLEIISSSIDRIKKIVFEKTTNLSKLADKVAPAVNENVQNGKYKDFSYTGHYWKLSNMTGSSIASVIPAINKIIPDTNDASKMKSILEGLEKDGWSIEDFKNKIVKEVYGSSKIADLPKEIYMKISGGEAKEIKSFTAVKPSAMISALKNMSKDGFINQTVKSYNDIKTSINDSIKTLESSKLSGASPVISEYIAKRVTVLQIALGIVTTVVNAENKALLDMSYEFARALQGLARMK